MSADERLRHMAEIGRAMSVAEHEYAQFAKSQPVWTVAEKIISLLHEGEYIKAMGCLDGLKTRLVPNPLFCLPYAELDSATTSIMRVIDNKGNASKNVEHAIRCMDSISINHRLKERQK